MIYLLDTDTCIFALKRVPSVIESLLSHKPTEVRVSVVTIGELRAGAEKSARVASNLARIDELIRPIEVVPVEPDDARAYGKLRARLERAGTPIGPLDTWIAAQALARGLVVVSSNTREFRRVSGLRVESWKVA